MAKRILWPPPSAAVIVSQRAWKVFLKKWSAMKLSALGPGWKPSGAKKDARVSDPSKPAAEVMLEPARGEKEKERKKEIR